MGGFDFSQGFPGVIVADPLFSFRLDSQFFDDVFDFGIRGTQFLRNAAGCEKVLLFLSFHVLPSLEDLAVCYKIPYMRTYGVLINEDYQRYKPKARAGQNRVMSSILGKEEIRNLFAFQVASITIYEYRRS